MAIALAACAALTGTASVTSAPAQAPAAPSAGEPTLAIAGGGACGPDLVEVATIDGASLCSHGPDPAATPASPSGGGVSPEATAGIQCYGNGVSGPRVQLVYVHPPSVNRYSSLKATMALRAGQMDAMFDASAAQTGGDRHVRWVTDSSCNVDIDSVTVSAGAISANSFSTLLNELVAKGYDDPDRKYLIWADTNNAIPNVCYGLATLWYDDRPGSENYNNTRAGYGRIDDTCLNNGFDGRVEAHELMHTLGAVQGSAPHATDSGHCTDDYDRMCYDDDGPGGDKISVVCSSGNEWRFDCRNDDYFHAAAPCGAGGYLSGHWNSAENRYLARTPAATGPPPANDGISGATGIKDYAGSTSASNAAATGSVGEPAHAGQAPSASVWYRWVAPVTGTVVFDTCGSDIDTVVAVYKGSAASYTALQPVAANDDHAAMAPQSAAQFAATAGTTYYVAVDGKGGDRGDIDVRWGAPLHGFHDVSLGAWYDSGLRWAKEYTLVSGFPDGTYRPKDAVNRGQVANMLWQLMGSPPGSSPAHFSDVSSSAWYKPALDWAVAAGLVTGFPDGTYRPKDALNRGQVVNMLWQMVGQPGGSPYHGFSDVPGDAWYGPALSWAKAQGLVTGFPGNVYKPKDPVNRAQISNMLFSLAANPDAWTAYGGAPPGTVVF